MQPPQRMAQRRKNIHGSGTFTFCYKRPRGIKQVSAWMLSRDTQEGAFLTTTGEAPRIGERLELAPDETKSRQTRIPPVDANEELPRFGRVVHIDAPQGNTRRVAIRFEQPLRSTPAST